MKIQCDVCERDEASLFCTADEAALCSACDHRVHLANKLAGKHQRFSLHHHPSPKQAPLCDICQERRAFLFCLQDRAILCRECDIQIHKSNEHTQKHTRFLLTGIKLSATPSIYSSSPSPNLNNYNDNNNNNIDKSSDAAVPNLKKPEDSNSTPPVCLNAPTSTPSNPKGTTFGSTTDQSTNVELMNCTISASSISDYLETLPGWHVEDFLDFSSSPSPFGFSKNMENEVVPFWESADFQNNIISAFLPTEKMGFCVPEVEPLLQQTYQSMEMPLNGYIEQHSKEFTTCNNNNNNNNNTKKTNEDNSFTVPQFIIPCSTVSKRQRTFY